MGIASDGLVGGEGCAGQERSAARAAERWVNQGGTRTHDTM